MSDFLTRLDECGKKLVPELSGGEAPTFDCPKCLDTLYLSHIRKGYTVSWFCTCQRATDAEAGYWFDRLFPPAGAGGRRVPSSTGRKEFDHYAKVYGDRMPWVKPAIEELQKQYEHTRTRKAKLEDSKQGRL